MCCENVVTFVMIIFSQLPRSRFLIDQIKKNAKSPQYFHINFTTITSSKLLMMDKKIISVVGPF